MFIFQLAAMTFLRLMEIANSLVTVWALAVWLTSDF